MIASVVIRWIPLNGNQNVGLPCSWPSLKRKSGAFARSGSRFARSLFPSWRGGRRMPCQNDPKPCAVIPLRYCSGRGCRDLDLFVGSNR